MTTILILFMIACLLLPVAIWIVKQRWKKYRQYKILVSVFKNQSITLPALEFGSSYEWPTFTVLFSNKSDYELAEEKGLFKLFDEQIDAFYGPDFRADLAIYYTYPGKPMNI